jgi:hypothetical protein
MPGSGGSVAYLIEAARPFAPVPLYREWIAHGYRYNGRSIHMRSGTYRQADDLGSYGYVIKTLRGRPFVAGEVRRRQADRQGSLPGHQRHARQGACQRRSCPLSRDGKPVSLPAQSSLWPDRLLRGRSASASLALGTGPGVFFGHSDAVPLGLTVTSSVDVRASQDILLDLGCTYHWVADTKDQLLLIRGGCHSALLRRDAAPRVSAFFPGRRRRTCPGG